MKERVEKEKAGSPSLQNGSKGKIIILLLLLSVAVLSILLIRKVNSKTWYEETGNIFGTAYHIKYKGTCSLKDSISAELQKVDNTFSIFNPQSLVSRLNTHQTDSVNSLLREVFQLSEEVFNVTDGAFDPTVRPAVEAWGFGKSETPSLPPEKIDSLRNLIGFHKVKLDGARLILPPGTTLDFGAIAKGYAVDRVASLLEKSGINNYIIEIGGEIRVLGTNPDGEPWIIGIVQPPTEPHVTATGLMPQNIRTTQGAVATSGNYNNTRLINGKRYSHTINPKTAMPQLSDILSATVIAPQCALADAYATAFMVMGRENAEKILSAVDTTKLKAILY